MTEILSAAQMRAIERAAIESGATTGLALMERAGAGVLDAMFAQWPDLAKDARPAVILCGPGNNGGDGFVVARLLRSLGWPVTVFIWGDPARLPPDAATNHARWLEMGPVAPLELAGLLRAGASALAGGAKSWIVVDALFGIGQRAPLDDVLAPVNALIDATFEHGAAPAPMVVAIDIPTGYDADTGAALARRPMPADLIVTFHARKPIHTMPNLADAACVVVDIGL